MKHKIFKNIKIAQNFPNVENAPLVDKLWNDFYHIYCDLTENQLIPETCKIRTKEWFVLFLQLYSPDKITPYIHSFVFHLHKQFQEHGDVNAFNEQGKINSHINTYRKISSVQLNFKVLRN